MDTNINKALPLWLVNDDKNRNGVVPCSFGWVGVVWVWVEAYVRMVTHDMSHCGS